MANLSEDEIAEMERAARRDETERCALLCETLADIHIKGADRDRREGTYYERAIWPPFRKVACVMPRHERQARMREEAASMLRTIATCIRRGYDPRKLEPDPNERIDLNADRDEDTGC